VNSLGEIAFRGIAFSVLFHIVVSFTYAQAPSNKAAPMIVGTWKLNAEKSNLTRAAANHLEIRQYRLRPDGFLVGLLITGDEAQGYHYLQFTARSDGKDYPEYSDQIVAEMIATGKQTPRTYGEKMIDEYVTEWVDKVDGRVTAQGKKIVSKDGKTLTITTDGGSQQRVYDRQ
jgi:hypothetical protein